jgi:precorrin-2 dehydrogenase/sirohydrochlorin ferrochelatase
VGVELVERGFRPGDLKGCDLVFCCADDGRVNAEVARRARGLGLWVCQSSEPCEGNLDVPAVVEAGGLRLTLSTQGASPAVAKALRSHFETQLRASDLQWLLTRLEGLRPRMKADPELKAALLKRLADSRAVLLALAPRSPRGRRRLADLLRP